MPELPDVEGFRRVVANHAAGQCIDDVEVFDSGVLHTSPHTFTRTVRERTIVTPRRHGKWLLVPLAEDEGYPWMLIHFGMTGSFEWDPAGDQAHRHDRVVLHLEEGALRYRDMRKLAGIWIANNRSDTDDLLGGLGPDAASMNRTELRQRLTRTRRGLKSALMDQTLVAGLGNLCVDEILWRAYLSPSAPTKALENGHWATLHARLRSVLTSSSHAGRVPDRPSWLTGHRDDPAGQCPRCSTPLSHGKVSGRSTVWCPFCQQADVRAAKQAPARF